MINITYYNMQMIIHQHKASVYGPILEALVIERIWNQRPTINVPPNVSTSVKEIWIGSVLLLDTLLVKFIPAPKPFWRKDDLG